MKKIIHVGVDVDDKNYTSALIAQDGKKFQFKTRPQFKALHQKLKKFVEEGYEIKVCYEATYIGSTLKRKFEEVGIDCEVVAPSLIPEKSSDKVKTDRRDSEKLALYYQRGLLTPVHVMTEEEESHRRLVRTRGSFVERIKSLKREILSHCRVFDVHYKQETEAKSYWTKSHFDYLNKLVLSDRKDRIFKVILENYLFSLESLTTSMSRLEEEIRSLACSDKYKRKVEALGCMKNLSDMSAMVLLTEIGDIKRFSHPKQLMSYAGLDIIENSSGSSIRKGGITKMGNKRIRTALVEASQNCQRPCVIGRGLKERRKDQPLNFIKIGDRSMKRLHKKANRLLHRGKPINKIKVACARELAGFVWEMLTTLQEVQEHEHLLKKQEMSA